jgi:HEAT repeat protein
VPASPAEITDDEVLASWSEDERDALKEMSPEERAKEMAKRRLEIFAQRGGVLAAEAPKPGDPPAAPQGGSRGPARPEVKRESAPVEFREILNDLASKDPEERARGAENAKSYPDKEAVAKYVLDVLPDPDPDVRAIIAATLGALRYEQAVAPLAALVDKPGEKDPVRMAAIKALHDIGGEKGIAALQKIVSEAGDPSDHATALAMLVTFRDAALVKDLLKPCLVDISADTRQQAVIAIREFSLREYEKDLLPLLDDASEQVVKDVMRTFGAFGTRAAVGPIVKILLKPDPEADSPEDIQTTANEALEKITGNKMGYDTSLSDEKIQAALDAWKTWWSKNRDKWK